ncbi:Vigilin [Halotydeus destructor]|nr:Vigilin [Halotydeus destructor]
MGRVDIPKEFHPFISGPFGDTAKQIARETETVIKMPSGKSCSRIIIDGKVAAVTKAREMIKRIYEEKKRTCQAVSVEVTKRLHRCLTKGQILQDILKNTSVAIELPSKKSTSEKLTILGEPEKLGHVLPLLYEMFYGEVDAKLDGLFWRFAFAFNTNTKQTPLTRFAVDVKVMSYLLQFLVERLGTDLKLFSQWSVRILLRVPVREEEESESQSVVTIKGKEDDVLMAEKRLADIIRDMQRNVKHEVRVVKKHHRYLVANKGALDKVLKGLGPVVVTFPKSKTKSDLVTIKGPAVCIEEAKNRILEKVDKLNSMVTIEFPLEERHRVAALNFRRSTEFQEFMIQNEVHVKFGRKSGLVLISGFPKECELAKTAILNATPVEIEVDVPFCYRGAIIGKQGAQISKIRETFGVEITLPKLEEESGNVVIAGGKDNADKARQYILDMIKRLDKEKADREGKVELHVAPEYHGLIIGRKGAVVAKIVADNDVRVRFPRLSDETAADPSLITILGSETNARRARDEILSLVNDIVTTKITYLDREALNSIMFYDGKGMALIKEEFKVGIQISGSGGAKSKMVSVTGFIEDVDAAIAHILVLEKEYLDEIKASYQVPDDTYSKNKKRKLEVY